MYCSSLLFEDFVVVASRVFRREFCIVVCEAIFWRIIGWPIQAMFAVVGFNARVYRVTTCASEFGQRTHCCFALPADVSPAPSGKLASRSRQRRHDKCEPRFRITFKHSADVLVFHTIYKGIRGHCFRLHLAIVTRLYGKPVDRWLNV